MTGSEIIRRDFFKDYRKGLSGIEKICDGEFFENNSKPFWQLTENPEKFLGSARKI